MTGARILVVEDEIIVAHSIQRSLVDAGYAVVAIASSGEEAVQKAHQTRPQLVLMDIKLRSGMDGVEAAERIRAQLAIPVVYLTAYADADTLQRAKATEPFGYVLKPFEARDLTTTIELALYRHGMERQLRESETRYRSLFQHVPIGLYRTTPDGRILDANPALIQMLGYPDRESLLSMRAAELYVDAQDRERETERLERNEMLRGYPVRLRRQDGVAIWVRDTVRAVRDATGKIVYFWGSLEDITERNRIEQERLRLAAAVEQSEEATIILDTQGVTQYVNAAFEQMTGHTREKALGQTAEALELQPWDARLYQEAKESLARSQTWTGHLSAKRGDGTPWEVEVAASTIRDENQQVVNYVVTLRDVTEQVALETQLRQAQKMEAVGQLAGGVAHDFNNLLTAIKGYADLLLTDLSPDDPSRWPPPRSVRGDIAEILQAANRAADLTQQLLAFSRKQMLQPRMVDLNALVVHMERMLRRLISEDIALTLMLSPTLGRIKADPTQIEQVVLNLAVNARDAMPRGGELTLETANVWLDEKYRRQHPEVEPGAYVSLGVSDTGVGMDERTQSRLFEPFFTTKEAGKGTGLGLATVYGIVRQSGGAIQVDSKLGVGSTFTVYLPRVDLAEPEGRVRDAREPRPGSETVLIVEDEETVRRLAARALRQQGYSVLEARGAEEAMLISSQHPGPIHLVVTDIVMPGPMSATDLVGSLLRTRPELRALYVSGHSAPVITHHGVVASEIDFLPKPFTPRSLSGKVRRILDRSR